MSTGRAAPGAGRPQSATNVVVGGGPVAANLELSEAKARELLAEVAERVLRFRADLADGTHPPSYVYDSTDVAAYDAGRQVCAELREEEIPQSGTDDLAELLDVLFGVAMTNGTMPHPGYLAHVPSGGLLQSAVGEFLAHALNRFAGVWLAAPGWQQLEANVIRWLCTMLGYDNSESWGYLTTGASLSTVMALRCALARADTTGRGAPVLYLSSESHFSVRKAARLAGLPADRVRLIGTGTDYRLDVAELIASVNADRDAGLRPACVVATAGTTNTGAVDDLAKITEYCAAEGVWSHVDGALGGFFRLTERGRTALRGIEDADSIAVDGHKSLFLPHGHGALLVKDRTALRAAFGLPDAAYLPGRVDDEPDIADFAAYGPELTRPNRGLAYWLPLKLHGLPAFVQALDERLDLAGYLASRLRHMPGIEVIDRHPMHLPVVCFRPIPATGQEPDASTARLCELVCSYRHAYLTTTRLVGEGLVVRACILDHRTDRTVVDQLLTDIARAVRQLHSGKR